MSHAPSFQFYPKQWLGDDKVLLMDWAARAMHLHLMCIAWQQDPPCTLPDDEEQWRRWCGNPHHETWSRARPQIQFAWRLCNGRWIQDGLRREWEKQRQYSESRRHAAEARWGKKDAYALRTQSVWNALQSSSSLKNKNKKNNAACSSDSQTAFERFWAAYPKKKSKGQAEKAWAKLKPDDLLLHTMLSKVEQAKHTPEWKKERGQFIPHPATWLNARGWEDELPAPGKERIPL